VLSSLGANSLSLIVSSEFPLRYYCKSHLYTTDEEGAAYFQLSRSDLVAWYERETSQERALKSKDLATIRTFAHGIGAEYVVLPDASVFMNTEEIDGDVVATTTRHIVIKLAQ
jgi:hypothetical protein